MLVPTPPFERENHQLRLALYIVPLVLASMVISRDTAVRLSTFAFGVALFGKPLFDQAKTQDIYREWAPYLSTSRYLTFSPRC